MIAEQLTENLQTAGIDTTQTPIDEAELHREVLIERNFDIFVIRHTGLEEPDALRSLLHSDYVGEQGWQNPFSFSDPTADESLDDQRAAAGDERLSTFDDLFSYLVQDETTPYTVAVYHDHIGAKRTEMGLSTVPYTPEEHVQAMFDPPDSESEERPLRIGLFGQQFVSRLNPIVVDLTDVNTILGLLYDPLTRRIDGEYVPWLADEIDWAEDEDDGGSVEATVTLREGVNWHDGEPLEASDVEFTYNFLKDTSLGDAENPVTAPRYRGRQTLIEDVTAVDRRTVTFEFESTSQEVAQWALTVPLLPEHIWDEQRELVNDQQTAALTWDNEEPVGSGLFEFVDADGDAQLELALFEEHVMLSSILDDLDGVPEEEDAGDLNGGFEETSSYEGLSFEVYPNEGAALDSLIDHDIDVIANEMSIDMLETIEEESDSVQPIIRETPSFYMIGFNDRHSALSNRRFRGVVSRLLDRDYIVEEFFDGHATRPERESELLGLHPSVWEANGRTAPITFPGDAGELDEAQTRELFEEAGYTYSNGDLIE